MPDIYPSWIIERKRTVQNLASFNIAARPPIPRPFVEHKDKLKRMPRCNTLPSLYRPEEPIAFSESAAKAAHPLPVASTARQTLGINCGQVRPVFKASSIAVPK